MLVTIVLAIGHSAAIADVMLYDIYLSDPDSSGGGIWRIRNDTTTLISGNGGVGSVGSGTGFFDPTGVIIQNATTLIVSDEALEEIFFVDVNTGARTVYGLSSSNDEPAGIAYDPQNGYIYFTDKTADFAGTNHFNSIVRVSTSGPENRTVISSSAPANLVGSGQALDTPHDIHFDGTNLIVTNRGTNEILSVDPTTGARTLLSGGAGPTGTGTNFTTPIGVDGRLNEFLVSDYGSNSLFLVDAAGNRTLVTSSIVGQPQDAVFDGLGNAYVVTDDETVVKVNLASGVITSVVSKAAGDFATSTSFATHSYMAIAIPEPSSLMFLGIIAMAAGFHCFSKYRRERLHFLLRKSS